MGSVGGDGERFAGGEAGEGGASVTKGAEIVGMRGGEVVAGGDGVLDEAAAVLAAANGVLVLEPGGGAAHGGSKLPITHRSEALRPYKAPTFGMKTKNENEIEN